MHQIREIHRTIQADLSYSKVSAERVFHINYEEFCKDTVKQLRAFTSFLQTHQVAINRTGKQIPTMFTKRSEVRIDTLLFEKMRQYARNSATTPLKS